MQYVMHNALALNSALLTGCLLYTTLVCPDSLTLDQGSFSASIDSCDSIKMVLLVTRN